MDRISVIQNIIDKKQYKTYLEIGTWKGDSFLPIKCKKKIAVDPNFQISLKTKLKWILRNPSNLHNRYFEMSSAEFFKNKSVYLQKAGLQDIIFIDGLHTFEASLNDILKSLEHLNNDGVILVHDCFPPNKAAATPAESLDDANKMGIAGWKKEWCGDVWKAIVYLKHQHEEELEVFVLNTDYGLGVIRIKREGFCTTINDDLFNKINLLDFEFLESNSNKCLDLREVNTDANFLDYFYQKG